MNSSAKFLSVIFALVFIFTIGMNAKEKEITLKTNMKCEACKVKIEEGLKSAKGVRSTEFDLAANTIKINYESNETNAGKITKTIKDTGFEASTNLSAMTEAKMCSTKDAKSCSTAEAKACTGDKADSKKCGDAKSCCTTKEAKAKPKSSK